MSLKIINKLFFFSLNYYSTIDADIKMFFSMNICAYPKYYNGTGICTDLYMMDPLQNKTTHSTAIYRLQNKTT